MEIGCFVVMKKPTDNCSYQSAGRKNSTISAKEDLRKLVYQAMQDNHISDPKALQPGQVVIVRVQEARTSK